MSRLAIAEDRLRLSGDICEKGITDNVGMLGCWNTGMLGCWDVYDPASCLRGWDIVDPCAVRGLEFWDSCNPV